MPITVSSIGSWSANKSTAENSKGRYSLNTALNNAKASISDHKKAEAVDGLIAEIGEVAFTTDCKDRIDEARAAYDALSADQKALVDNYATLVAAEETYADLASKGKTEIVDDDNGVSIETTDGTTISENIELKVEVRSSVSEKESDADYEKIKAVLEKNEEILKVYDVKLIRIVNGVETTDYYTKEGFTTKNIIIEKISYSPCSDGYYWDLHTTGSGSGYYITNGKAVPIKWSKSSRKAKTKYTYNDGKEIEVSDGRTYIQVTVRNYTIK